MLELRSNVNRGPPDEFFRFENRSEMTKRRKQQNRIVTIRSSGI